jgi:putative toxin-antitoxin system antitoxin component (TIGR02293 family)
VEKKTEIKRYQLAEEGLQTNMVREFEVAYGISKHEMADLMGISEKTYYNLLLKDKLDRERSDRFLFIEKIFEEGEETFIGKQNFNSWLRQPHPSLENQKPIDLLDSLNGAQAVHAEIIRTRHNVLS